MTQNVISRLQYRAKVRSEDTMKASSSTHRKQLELGCVELCPSKCVSEDSSKLLAGDIHLAGLVDHCLNAEPCRH